MGVKPGLPRIVTGRSAIGVATNRQLCLPRSTGRNPAAVSGYRQGESKNNKPKRDAGKLTIPPLLSPLDMTLEPGKGVSSPSGAGKSPSDKTTSGRVASKPSRVAEHRTESRKPKTRVPPLLSPTLPPIVERRLVRRKMTPSKGESDGQGGPNRPVLQRERRDARKSYDMVLKNVHRVLPRPPPRPPPRPTRPAPKKRSLVVRLECGKRIARKIQMVLSRPPASVKEGARKEREREKKRSRLLDPGPPPPPAAASASTPSHSQARKRPMPHNYETSSRANKKPRTNETVRGKALVPLGSQSATAPSTPSKATAMARVASNSSVMGRLGETKAPSPPPTNQTKDHSLRPMDEETSRAAERMRKEGQRFINLGTKLKHQRDEIMGYKSRGAAEHASPAPSQVRKACAVGVESLMAYTIGFKVLNEGRDMERKPKDARGWESLIPHLRIIRGETRHYVQLQGLVTVLSAVVLEELECVMASGFPGAGDANQFQGWIKRMMDLVRMRVQAWQRGRQGLVRMRNLGWTGTAARLEQVGPWMNGEDVVWIGLKVLKKWTDDEGVDWTGELLESLKDREQDGKREGAGGADW